MQSFPGWASARPDGMRPQHTGDTMKQSAEVSGCFLLEPLHFWFILSCVVQFYNWFAPFYAANLAFNKNNGGVHLIAVGSTFYRLQLPAKCACLLVRNEMAELLSFFQLGYGSKGGVAQEAIYRK